MCSMYISCATQVDRSGLHLLHHSCQHAQQRVLCGHHSLRWFSHLHFWHVLHKTSSHRAAETVCLPKRVCIGWHHFLIVYVTTHRYNRQERLLCGAFHMYRVPVLASLLKMCSRHWLLTRTWTMTKFVLCWLHHCTYM